MPGSSLVTQITQLILNWKLKEASALLEAKQSDLAVKDIFEMKGLLEHYQEIQYTFEEVGHKLESDSVGAQYILSQIPEDIRVTHPDYEAYTGKINAAKDEKATAQAEAKIDAAYDAIVMEFNSAKAAEAIESAKQLSPNWDRVPALRDKILKTTELQEKLASGIFLQTEVSALREKGGLASYQRAMVLINEYTALGLESFGIHLFDAEKEREDLLKMITRAEGESWSNRLSSEATSEESLRLEQSIRSLEDAESRNLRVLYNNNAKLIILLTNEGVELDPTSEKAIQSSVRIAELRKKNLAIETEIHDEVGKRANAYCEIARKALETGELATVEINIRLAREAGKPAEETHEEDYLGEVSLPTLTLDTIRSLEESYNGALVRRNEISEKYHAIRDEYNADDNLTINKLFSWVNAVDEFYEQDAFTPGLTQFRSEIHTRYDAVKAYAFEKGLNDIDRAIQKGDFAEAKTRLEPLNSYVLTSDEKKQLKQRQTDINKLEDVVNQAEGLLSDADAAYQQAIDRLPVSSEAIQQLGDRYQRVVDIYARNSLPEPALITEKRKRQTDSLQQLNAHQPEIEILQQAMSREVMTIESIKTAETLELSDAMTLPPGKRLLAKFWYFCAKTDSNRDNAPRYLAKAEKLAEESEDAALFREISQYRIDLNNANAEGQRVNFILEMLNHFSGEKEFVGGMDYISKNTTDEDRKNPQLHQAIERIEQSYRISQADFFLKSARASLEAGETQEAEEAIAKSLDFFYTIEAAQLQKVITSRQTAEDTALQEIEHFLETQTEGDAPITEEAAEEIRYVADKIRQLEKQGIRDKKISSRISIAKNRIDRLRNQETVDFNNLKRQFENSLLIGEDGIEAGEQVLRQMESRTWIDNRSDEILQAKLKQDEIRNVSNALKLLIKQADKFVRQGDFRSAERILSAFHAGDEANWPDWLLILKENTENRIQELKKKYQQIQSRFSQTDEEPGEVIQEVALILNPKQTDPNQNFKLANELGQYKTILEKDIQVDPEKNVHIGQINYLLELLRWVESSNDTIHGTGTKASEPTMDAIYATRKVGRDLFEKIPAGLVGIQPAFAERNKWLEQRTQVQQLLAQVQENLRSGNQKKRREDRQQAVAAGMRELDRIELLPREASAVSRIKKMLERRSKRKGCLIGGIVGLFLILGSLYLAAPRLIPLLTPSPTESLTPSITLTPSLTPTATQTATMTPTYTPTLTLTPSPTFTLTPTPMGLRAVIENNRIGVYELPDGNRVMLSDGYLEMGSEVTVIRYCESAFPKGEYWALIYYPSEFRNTGWIRVRLPESPDFVSMSNLGQPVEEILLENPALRMTCPTLPYQRMPGDEVTATPSPTP